MRTRLVTLAAFALGTALGANVSHATTTVTRPVSVQAVTPDSVTIVWNTADSTDAAVDFGESLEYGRAAESKELSRQHAVTLYHLLPGTHYFYRVRCGGQVLDEGPDYHFSTPPDKRSARVRFLAFGDSGKGSPAQYSLVPSMVQARPDFMIHVGDVIYPSGAAKDFDPEYFVPYKDFLRNTPVWLAIGNHDDATNHAQPYLDAYFLPRNGPDGNERNYTFNWGNAHFVCLDSNGMFTPAVLDWLEQDLANCTSTWKFVFFHHPPYSCGMHGSSSSLRHQVAPLFEAYGVDLVFSGHDHDYQRSWPMLAEAVVDSAGSPNFVRPRGVIYIVTGGGAGPRPTSSSCAFTAAAVAATHFTQIDIDGDLLTLQSLNAGGGLLDHMSVDKSPAPGRLLGGPETAPLQAELLANEPNPFNPFTVLRYSLRAPGTVRLGVYDLAGRTVRQMELGEQPPGEHRVLWNGADARGGRVASGLYFVRLEAGGATVTRKIILAK